MAEYIERNKLIKDGWHLQRYVYGKDYACLESMRIQDIPAADVRPVVLCRDCKHYQADCGWCGYFDIGMNVNDFCSRWKKREES